MVPRRSSSYVHWRPTAKAERRVSLILRTIAVASFVALSRPTDGLAQFCFRGRPLPECKSQALTEFMLGARFAEAQPLAENLLVASAELGGLVNATSRSSFGGTILAGFNGGGTRLGIKARYRRRITGSTALDLAPGILVAGATSSSIAGFRAPGFTGHVGLAWKDWAALTLQFEVVRFVDDGDLGGPLRTNASLAAGGRLGSYAGAGAAVVALGLAILYAAAASSLD
jgi:hypothetical protein